MSDNEETKQDISRERLDEPVKLQDLAPKLAEIGKFDSENSLEFINKLNSRIEGKNGQHKGLRLLTIVVKDIVMTRKYTTYKEVADIILKDGSQQKVQHVTHIRITPEEQNIKRRVYDALNVLIAAKVLIKEGRFVRKNRSNKIIQINKLDIKLVSSKETTPTRHPSKDSRH